MNGKNERNEWLEGLSKIKMQEYAINESDEWKGEKWKLWNQWMEWNDWMELMNRMKEYNEGMNEWNNNWNEYME